MKHVIIVGRGLAAYTLAYFFRRNEVKTILIGDRNLSRSSYVAGGIWNPIVIKRMTSSWKAAELVLFLEEFYTSLEKELSTKLITSRQFIRPFSEMQEIKLWKKKANGDLSEFLSKEVFEQKEDFPQCKMKLGYGKVLKAGNLNVPLYLKKSEEYFQEKIIHGVFDHADLALHPDKVEYKGMIADGIVFCEGWLVKDNPYFNYLPMKPVKGEVLEIKCESLDLQNSIINKGGYIMDIEKSKYKVGATYDWETLNEEPSEKAREELTENIRGMISAPFEAARQEAGVRPSTIDRRPMFGRHPSHHNLYIFNGLGTKGVMLAPYFASNFVNFVLGKGPLHPETDIARFLKQYAL